VKVPGAELVLESSAELQAALEFIFACHTVLDPVNVEAFEC
jgi:hypothetical protein